MHTPSGMLGKAVLVAVLCGASACAAPQQTAAPVTTSDLQEILNAIKQNQIEGKTGAIKGVGILPMTPAPPVPLNNTAISLIPSTPELESALAAINQRWREGRRRPVSTAEFQSAFAVLDRHVRSLHDLGERSLLQLAETDDKGLFAFETVPAGRWILVTTMESPVSAILWALPGDVKPGQISQVLVSTNNILLEGQVTNDQPPPSR